MDSKEILDRIKSMTPAERWPFLRRALRMDKKPNEILFALLILIEPEAAEGITEELERWIAES